MVCYQNTNIYLFLCRIYIIIKVVFIYQRKKRIQSFYYSKMSNFSEEFSTNENYHLHLVFTDANLERDNSINS